MERELFLHTISPQKVIRGSNAWDKGKHLISSICKRPLFIGRSNKTYYIREKLFEYKSNQKSSHLVSYMGVLLGLFFEKPVEFLKIFKFKLLIKMRILFFKSIRLIFN